ncbi:MaoC family dehydratase [Nocardioides jensenii]|uniref:MaoC family dehydratase n=1 Tax=Nocardioides jensenii TaxID=1843 RepID=UPI00082BCBB0|nr:MaoC family dehydratase [Nocardioides jensenii]
MTHPVPPSPVHPDVSVPAVGTQLPELVLPITRTMIVATAIASRDYQDVHHDPALAQDRGSPDIFMNILTSNGLAERFVTNWAGPAARVKRVKIRLGAPNHPGDTMTMTGQVTGVRPETGTTVIEVAVRGDNRIGMHLSGTVEVVLRAHEETQ